MTEPQTEDQRRAVLAAEFSLGLLNDADRAEALRLLEIDPEFAAHVARWDIEIDDWHAEGREEEEAPSVELWHRIAASTGQRVLSSTAATPGKRVSSAWRITALAASVSAVVFASLWLAALGRKAEPERVQMVTAPLKHLSIAQVQDTDDERLLAVVYDRATGRLLARVATLDTKGRVPELWLIGSDGKPRSLGASRSGGEVSITLPPETRSLFADGATIAISLEPSAPAPHGAPVGPILGTAKISAI